MLKCILNLIELVLCEAESEDRVPQSGGFGGMYTAQHGFDDWTVHGCQHHKIIIRY